MTLPAPPAHPAPPAVGGPLRAAPPCPEDGARLAPALGAVVRLFCVRFMPEVEPGPRALEPGGSPRR